MAKTGTAWLEEYESILQKFADGEMLRLEFIARLHALGCSRVEISETICVMGKVGAP